MTEIDDPDDVLPIPTPLRLSSDEGACHGKPTPTEAEIPANSKQDGKAVARDQNYDQGTELQSQSEPYKDMLVQELPHRQKQRAQVILLQTTLRSSQFEKAGKRLHLPISGHWAVEICGEVFELNRMETWIWGAPHAFRQIYGTPSGLADMISSNFFGLILNLINILGLKPQVASRAQIDTSRLSEYLEAREKWTEPLLLGTTMMLQTEIHRISKRIETFIFVFNLFAKREIVARGNKHTMFYSIYSNNCQHFILDLCEYIEVKVESQFSRTSRSASSTHTDMPAYEEMQRDLGTQVAAQSSNIQSLWIRSRLVMLLGNGLHFVFSVMPVLVAILGARLSSNPDIAFRLAVGFSTPFYIFHAWLVCSVIILSWESQPKTLDKTRYLHGTCYTGSYLRRLVLAHPSPSLRVLIRFFLRVERWPYESFLLVGSVVAALLALGLLSLSDCYQDLAILPRIALVWAPFMSLIIEVSLLYSTLKVNIQRLRLGKG